MVGSGGISTPDDMRLWPFRDSGLTAVDFDDPPAFESQATYLQRLDLLQHGEATRLSARDFLPNVMTKAELTAAVERRRLWNERAGIPQQL